MENVGFTLIELLLTIGIISILAAMLFPSLLNVRKTANDADASSFLRNSITIAEIKRSENNDVAVFTTPTPCTPALQSTTTASVVDCQFRQDGNATYGYVEASTGHFFYFDGQRINGPTDTVRSSW